MDSPSLILTLIPSDKLGLAEQAVLLPHNRSRYYGPAICDLERDADTLSRETTPAPSVTEDDLCGRSLPSCIQLDFDTPPKDPGKGFSFGVSRQCDILLGPRDSRGRYISNVHFYITYDKHSRLVLRDNNSLNGTRVTYSSNLDVREWGEWKKNFTWILDLNRDSDRQTMEVHLYNGLSFSIQLADHRASRANMMEHQMRINSFLVNRESSPLSFSEFGIYSPTAEASQAQTPKNQPLYLREKQIGAGSNSKVYMVIDVSTADCYAQKVYRATSVEEYTRREITLLQKCSHEHIVQMIAHDESRYSWILFPFYPQGSIKDYFDQNSLGMDVVKALLLQSLEAIAYLHTIGIVHRDLKPANILVEETLPLHVRLADFGLAKQYAPEVDLTTFCGTKTYAAPEIIHNTPTKYNSSVDIWSLGVIGLQYAHGLPDIRDNRSVPNQIFNHIPDSGPLIRTIRNGMLRMNPKERFSAGECLEEMEYEVLELPFLCNRAPSRESAKDGSTTLILSTLWNQNSENIPITKSSMLATKRPLDCVDTEELVKRPTTEARSTSPRYRFYCRLLKNIVVRLQLKPRRVCFTSYALVAGKTRFWVEHELQTIPEIQKESYESQGFSGTLIDLGLMESYIQDWGLQLSRDWLYFAGNDYTVNPYYPIEVGHVLYDPIFVDDALIVTNAEMRTVNATHILRAKGIHRTSLGRFLRELNIVSRLVVRGGVVVQGTYVNEEDAERLGKAVGLKIQEALSMRKKADLVE